jgi:TRAP-type uncharacterized transport system substrate-binding protein
MISVKLPFWLRVVVVIAAVCIFAGASFLTYRFFSSPTTLTVAVGSLDGEAARAMSAIASRLAETNAPVRLKVIDTGTVMDAAKAFSAGTVDLAVVRGDVGDLSKAAAVAIVAHAVVLIGAPSGSSIDDVAGLKGRTVGVVGGEVNRNVVSVLTGEYGLADKVRFKDIAPADAQKALQGKEIGALIVTIPLSERYLSLFRSLFPSNAKAAPVLIPIESAEAIAQNHKAYESFDLPKGTIRGSPAVPADDLTTLRVNFYLVAQKKLDSGVIAALTQSVMSARRDLLSELPVLAQIAAANTDPDAFIPAHPGAAAFYNGTQESFLDKYSNAIFLTPMVLGALASIVAAAWKFLGFGNDTKDGVLDSLYVLARRIRNADSEVELTDIEDQIDDILKMQLAKNAAGDDDAIDTGTLNLAAHRLDNLVHYRRAALATGHADRPAA